MAFIRYRQVGNNEYAYSVEAYWDSKLKKSRQRTTYLGIVVDKQKGTYRLPRKEKMANELILDFGDSFMIHETIKSTPFYEVIQESFPDLSNEVLALSYHKICNPSAMSLAKNFYTGNYVSQLFKGIDISSQKISGLLKTIGEEKTLRSFFKSYIKTVQDRENGLIIDSTALPNQIHIPFTSWGYSDSNIEMSIKFLFVTTKESGSPLYFRYMPGSIPDVSLVTNTLEELKEYGVTSSIALLDAGFYSQENITKLTEAKLPFLTRLPASRKIFKELIVKTAPSLNTANNAIKYGKRILYVKHEPIEIDGLNLNAYVILDPDKKQKQINKILVNLIEDDLIDDNTDSELLKQGIFILISSFHIDIKQIVPLYYKRQKVEQLFAIAKSDLDILPLRVHSESTLRGYLLINFVALCIYVLLNNALGSNYSMEETLQIMRNLKCKVYTDKLLISETTKVQREIFEHLKILVPKTTGI